MEGERTPKLLLHGEYSEGSPMISPDGKYLAYRSNEFGQNEIYVRPFPDVDSGGRWQVSTSGGRFPIWSPNGKELFYRSPDGIMAVGVETEPTFKLDTPRILFQDNNSNYWDIHPDGKRFVMIKPPTSTNEESALEIPRKINIILNWFEELKERVPKE